MAENAPDCQINHELLYECVVVNGLVILYWCTVCYFCAKHTVKVNIIQLNCARFKCMSTAELSVMTLCAMQNYNVKSITEFAFFTESQFSYYEKATFYNLYILQSWKLGSSNLKKQESKKN